MSEQTTILLLSWLRLFAVTQVVEVPIYWFALSERPAWQRLLIGFTASLLTHPLFVLVLHRPLLALGPTGALVIGELLVVAVEGLWLRWFEVEQPWLWALTANAASVAVGLTMASLLRAMG